jgi:hypothetical protein
MAGGGRAAHCFEYLPGGYKEMSSVFADQKRPRIRVQLRVDWGRGGGGLRGLGQ